MVESDMTAAVFWRSIPPLCAHITGLSIRLPPEAVLTTDYGLLIT
jgi:hypothetical protein